MANTTDAKTTKAAEPQALAYKIPKRVTMPGLVKLGREVLGIEDLRPGQEEALRGILQKKDVLAVMPTGSGKSLLYQLPSLVLPGITVVVSPLLALIKDQVEKMQKKGVAVARADSTLTVKQKRDMMALLDAPGGKLLLTTPERMANEEFRDFLKGAAGQVGVSLFVVDEAHCVSQWGHDFRPAYLTIRQALVELGRPPVLATTATAPPHVREDIVHQLDMEKAKVVTTSFERDNLHFEVITAPGEDDKKKILRSLVKKFPAPGIVYCATVRAVEELAEDLSRHGVPATAYHGRMNKGDRDRAQAAFMEPGSRQVMVATNAFGLGVDKPDIRYVLHYHVPGSLEAYAQEAGRGGRDGKPCRCVLLFSPDDVAIQEFFLKGTYPSRKQVMAVMDTLTAYQAQGENPGLKELATSSQVGTSRTRTVVSLMKDEGWVFEERGAKFHLSDPPPDRELVRERGKEYEKRRIADRHRLNALLTYVRAEGCRNQIILDYLGEPDAPPCERCDNDLRSRAESQEASQEAAKLEDIIARMTAQAEGVADVLEAQQRKARVRVIDLDQLDHLTPGAALAEQQALDDEDYEPPEIEEHLDTTAADLAAAPDDEEGEITILKRKKKLKEEEPVAASEGDGVKKRKRRRKKKKKQLSPAPSAFQTPVLTVESKPGANTVTRRGVFRGAAPVIEYVRTPMKIASSPVASATPNDSAQWVSRTRFGKRKKRRGTALPAGGGQNQQARSVAPAGAAGSAPPAPGQPSLPGQGKKRRRRRRRKNRGAGENQAPVTSFWTSTASGPAPGPDGQGRAPDGLPSPPGQGKKRRRRRRRKNRGGGSGEAQQTQSASAGQSSSSAGPGSSEE